MSFINKNNKKNLIRISLGILLCFSLLSCNAFTSVTKIPGGGQYSSKNNIYIADAILIESPTSSGTYSLSIVIINANDYDDELSSISIDSSYKSTARIILGVPQKIEAKSKRQFGVKLTDEQIILQHFQPSKPMLSSYVPVQFTFRQSGLLLVDLLIVPAIDEYENLKPRL